MAPFLTTDLGNHSLREFEGQSQCWLSQVSSALNWLQIFIEGQSGSLTRHFRHDAHFNVERKGELVLDASTTGLGGYLLIQDKVVSYFADQLTEWDEWRFGHARGSSTGQQVWESLGALVALRLWSHHWKDSRLSIRVTGDSVAMLTLVTKMRPPTASLGLGIIAREMALDVADMVYTPDIAAHIPGIANLSADVLSRKFETKGWRLPAMFEGVPEAIPPRRDANYFRTLINDKGDI